MYSLIFPFRLRWKRYNFAVSTNYGPKVTLQSFQLARICIRSVICTPLSSRTLYDKDPLGYFIGLFIIQAFLFSCCRTTNVSRNNEKKNPSSSFQVKNLPTKWYMKMVMRIFFPFRNCLLPWKFLWLFFSLNSLKRFHNI